MMRVNPNSFWVLFILMASTSCGVNQPNAQQVLDKAIARHGFLPEPDLNMSFDFRGNHFTALLSGNGDVYKRFSTEGSDEIEDMVTSESFSRKVNHEAVDVEEESMWKFSDDTRSVVYFALLPYGAKHEALSIQLMPSIEIKGESYYKVEITYGKNGGGRDFENVFVYWIHQKEFTIDYLAYSFHINGGGVRFREAYNPREINGIRFQDYINYTIEKDYPAHELDYAFKTGQLKEISRIDLDNIEVNR